MNCPTRRRFFTRRGAAALFLVFTFLYFSPYFQVHPLSEGEAEGGASRNKVATDVEREGTTQRGREGNTRGEEGDDEGANRGEQGRANGLPEEEHLEEETKDIRPPPQKANQNSSHFPLNILLLASMGRSGSSFLGGLLNTQKKVVYFFEPFHDIQQQNLLTEKTVVNGLKGIFTCDIPNPILSTFQNNPNFVFRNSHIKCRGSKNCLSRESINTRCRRTNIRVVKTIRTRASWLPPIMNDDNVNMKVIHLVRDPRATIISAWGRGWTFIKAADVCQDLADDLQTGVLFSKMYPDQYKAVLYEDLCDNPWDMTRHIFTYLGYESIPTSTVRFLRGYTSGGRDSGSPYSLRRNTSRMKQKWRWDITQQQLKEIEEACGPVIARLGFQLFGTIENVRNASVPLFNSTLRGYNLFNYDIA